MDEKTLIIGGAGVAGAATALAATDVFDKVYLIDDPYPSFVPASQGLQRIVRANYPESEAYERLAFESLEQMKMKNGLLSPYFHESERHVLQPGGTGSARKTFREIDFGKLNGEYDKQPAGRIDAAEALKCIIQMAQNHPRVEFIRERVTSLLWDGDTCIGVQTIEGSTVHSYFAAKVLLTMGYQVPAFLASQGKQMKDGLCKTAIVPWGEVQLTQKQYEELKKDAITIVPGIGRSYLLWFTEAKLTYRGEYLLGTEQRILVNNARTLEVTNLEQVVQEYSLQEKPKYHKETHDLCRWFLPQLKDAPFTLHYCLDLITANQHFLIRPVPDCRGLYMACGFSFHGFKFIAVIGKYIVAMMEETLDLELLELWSGSVNGNEIHAEVKPHRKYGDKEL